MKIIDQTPFFNNETGEISLLDRGKALMKYGAGWIKEVEGQKQVITVLGKVLDRNYTLLRNVTPPVLEASFPFILVGPAGVFVMYVTPLTGMFRAKGDQWGTITGNTFKNEKPNLLTRTERMARAIQVFLHRQGYSEITTVDAILLCSDPSVHVDSIRPIIRVVMRDALERFAISIMQARVVLSPESVQDVIERILNPPKPAPPQPAETLAAAGPETLVSAQVEEPYVPAFALPESQAPAWSNEPASLPIAGTEARSQVPRRKGLNKKQWAFLIVMLVIWCLLITAFLFLVIKDQRSFLLSLLP
ncbi:MAG: hypothetical protein Q8N46_04270 [Anaerolineales bacterium]|nr:hypothetical protein [Anaerolineales bacterium]